MENFTIANNGFIRNKNLSLKAKGLMIFLLSLNDTWDFSIEGLQSVLCEGETIIRNAIQELKKEGYIQVKPIRENGKVLAYEYTVIEVPENLNLEKLDSVFLNPENLNPENHKAAQNIIEATLEKKLLCEKLDPEKLDSGFQGQINNNTNNNLNKQENNKINILEENFFSNSKYFGKYKLFEKDMKEGLEKDMNKLEINFKHHWNVFLKNPENLKIQSENFTEYFLAAFRKKIKFGTIVWKEHLFSESIYHENFDLFFKHAEKVIIDNPNVDVKFYFESIRDYTKRDTYKNKDWMLVLRAWIRSDIKNNGKYKEISQKEQMKTTKINPYEHMTPDEIRQIQIENGSLGAPKYRRSMVADPQKGHINEIGDIFDGILNGLK